MSNTRQTGSNELINEELENNKKDTKEKQPGLYVQTQQYDNTSQVSRFVRQSNLVGRGQVGVAGFYQIEHSNNNSQYLIKVDDPATCLLEGSACFANIVMPDILKNSVSFAHAGTASIDDSEDELAVSIQPKLDGFKPWDVIITNQKRDPKTLVSFEAKHMDEIDQSIDHMTEYAKNQLSMAIVMSGVVGDESLHVGQFMARKDNDGLISDICRIDFGARERFSVVRANMKDFTHGTSLAYQGSGQLGKDYVSFYMTHPDIRTRVMHIWLRPEIDTNALAKQYKFELIRQFNNIPTDKQAEALKGVLAVINKKAPDKVSFDNINDLADYMSQIMELRINTLKNSAKAILDNSLLHAFKEMQIIKVKPRDVKKLQFNIKKLLDSNTWSKVMLYYNCITNDLGKIQPPKAAIEVISQLQAKLQFEYSYNTNSQQANLVHDALVHLNDLQAKYKVLSELQTYKKYLPLNESTVDKQIALDEALFQLTNDMALPSGQRQDIRAIITPVFDETLSQIRNFGTVSEGSKLMSRIKEHLVGYTPPPIIVKPKNVPTVAPPPIPTTNSKLKI